MTLQSFLAALTTAFGDDRFRQNELLAEHTTLRVGGPADVWLPVETVPELVEAVRLARQHQTPFLILGGGANLLITDAGVRGLVIQNRCTHVDFPAETGAEGQPITVTAESGVVLPNFARRCARRGLSGMEWAVGVPGTIGGAVVNNAGAYGSDMARSLQRAELLSPEGERVWQPEAWFDYTYRASRLKGQQNNHWIVLRAELQMVVAPVDRIKKQIDIFNVQRKTSQPPGASSGSMFKNPPGDYAGRLVEAAGLKGHRVGQAQISPVHANFFVNLGGAAAADILALIETAQEAVNQRFGIELELEIEVMGES